jgi:hypothetical protein
MKILHVLIVVLTLSSFKGVSQDTVVFLSGKTISGNITSANKSGISITTKGLLFKNSRQFYKDELFSMSIDNHKSILYSPDSTNGIEFNVLQMSYYIKGLQYGKKHYHAPFATIGGFTSGVTGGLLGFWGITIPTVYVLLTGIKTPKVKSSFENIENILPAKEENPGTYGLKYNTPTTIENNEKAQYVSYYNSGYQTAAKDKKIKNAIKGGIIGFVALIASSYLLIIR